MKIGELHRIALIVEAQPQGWPGDSPQPLADLARQINAGKRLRFQNRLSPDAMPEWDRYVLLR